MYGDGVCDRRGRITRLSGVTVDITDRKRTEEPQSLLTREADHRAKNALARRAVDRTPDRSRHRQGLCRSRRGPHRRADAAHTLLAQCHWQGADLSTLVEEELAAYRTSEASGSPRAGGKFGWSREQLGKVTRQQRTTSSNQEPSDCYGR